MESDDTQPNSQDEESNPIWNGQLTYQLLEAIKPEEDCYNEQGLIEDPTGFEEILSQEQRNSPNIFNPNYLAEELPPYDEQYLAETVSNDLFFEETDFDEHLMTDQAQMEGNLIIENPPYPDYKLVYQSYEQSSASTVNYDNPSQSQRVSFKTPLPLHEERNDLKTDPTVAREQSPSFPKVKEKNECAESNKKSQGSLPQNYWIEKPIKEEREKILNEYIKEEEVSLENEGPETSSAYYENYQYDGNTDQSQESLQNLKKKRIWSTFDEDKIKFLKPMAFTTNQNLAQKLNNNRERASPVIKSGSQSLYAVHSPIPSLLNAQPKEGQTSRSRSALTNAIAAAAAQIPEKLPEHNRASVLKGQTWTIHEQARERAEKVRERLEPPPVKNIKKLFNSLPIGSTSYDEPGSSRDPAEISLFNIKKEKTVQPAEWVNAADNKIVVSKDFSEYNTKKSRRRLISNKNDQNAEDLLVIDGFHRPSWSYSCLIALALKNSKFGYLTVSEIYAFIMFYFPYFRKAPEGWRNSVRHNLSLNKAFAKVDINQSDPVFMKRCSYWMIAPDRLSRLDADIKKWKERDPDPAGQIHGIAYPESLEELVAGTKGMPPEDENKPLFYRKKSKNMVDHQLVKSEVDSKEEEFKEFKISDYFMNDSEKSFNFSSSAMEDHPPLEDPILEETPEEAYIPSMMGNHNFISNEMLFEDSPLMDHLYRNNSQDTNEPTTFPSHLEQTPEKTAQRRHPKSLFSPLKDETNMIRSMIRSVNPAIDADSLQGVYHNCLGSFDSAVSAVNDNSLLHYSQGTSSKMPTTFPDDM